MGGRWQAWLGIAIAAVLHATPGSASVCTTTVVTTYTVTNLLGGIIGTPDPSFEACSGGPAGRSEFDGFSDTPGPDDTFHIVVSAVDDDTFKIEGTVTDGDDFEPANNPAFALLSAFEVDLSQIGWANGPGIITAVDLIPSAPFDATTFLVEGFTADTIDLQVKSLAFQCPQPNCTIAFTVGFIDITADHSRVSEPGTLALIGLGVVGLGLATRRRRGGRSAPRLSR